MTSCFDDWVLAERDALRTAAADAIEASAARSDDPVESLRLARAVMAIDPLRASAYGLAIRAQLAQGERAEALRTYHRCAEVLQRDLGIEPGPEIVAVYELIRGDAGPEGGGPRATAASSGAHPLVGRAAELAVLV